MASRIETTRDQIATALGTITVANGYQNNIANVSKAVVHPDIVSEWPHLCIELGKSVVKPKDDFRTLFDEITEVFLVGYVRSDTETTTDIANISELQDAMESLVWDLKKKICSDLIKVNVNNASNKWNVELTNGRLEFTRASMLGRGGNIGIVETSFTIHLRNLDGSFDD